MEREEYSLKANKIAAKIYNHYGISSGIPYNVVESIVWQTLEMYNEEKVE